MAGAARRPEGENHWAHAIYYRQELKSELREQLRELAAKLPRYGYKRLCRRLRRNGVKVNHKKIYRLYREEASWSASVFASAWSAEPRSRRHPSARISAGRWTSSPIRSRVVTGSVP